MSAVTNEAERNNGNGTNVDFKGLKVEKEEAEEDGSDEEKETCESGLSSFALAALNEYLAESTEAVDSLKLPAEDFKMSQFWFDEESREILEFKPI